MLKVRIAQKFRKPLKVPSPPGETLKTLKVPTGPPPRPCRPPVADSSSPRYRSAMDSSASVSSPLVVVQANMDKENAGNKASSYISPHTVPKQVPTPPPTIVVDDV